MAKQVLQLDSIEAVTEFNQWLRGMDETAMLLWRTSVENLAGARSRRWATVLGVAGIQCILVVATAVFLELDSSGDLAFLLSGVGLFVGMVALAALRTQGSEVKAALTQKTLLERKLGFMHGQLGGVDMAVHLPAKRATADRLATTGHWPFWRPTEELALLGWALHIGFVALFVTGMVWAV